MRLFRRIINTVRGDSQGQKADAPASPQGSTGLPTDLPPVPNRQGEKDLFSFESISEHKRGGTDELVEKIAAVTPGLKEMLASQSLDEQLKIVQSKLAPEDYPRLMSTLSIVEFHYKEKENRLTEALSISKLRHKLATMLPEDLDPQKSMEQTRSRHIADSLQDLGLTYADMGEPSKALDYFHQAEDWYDRDQEERKERGINIESTFDRLFHQKDVRSTMFRNMARLYDHLGDEEKARHYARRASELDRKRPTVETRIDELFNIADGAASAGEFNTALRALHEALDLAVNDPNSVIVTREIATASYHLGNTLATLRLFRQALLYLQKALDLNRRAGHLERMTYDYLAIGRVLEARPDLGDALESYEAALRCASLKSEGSPAFTWEASDKKIYRALDPSLASQAAVAMAHVCVQRQDYTRADKLLALAIELVEIMRSRVVQDEYRIGFQSNRMKAYESMVELHARLALQSQESGDTARGHAIKAWEYGERGRGRAFLDLLGASTIPPPEGIPDQLREQERELIARLRLLSQSRPTASAEQHRAIWDEYESTREKLGQVWKAMSAVAPASDDYIEVRQGQPIKVETIRELLKQ